MLELVPQAAEEAARCNAQALLCAQATLTLAHACAHAGGRAVVSPRTARALGTGRLG